MLTMAKASADNVDKAIFNQAELRRYVLELAQNHGCNKNEIIAELTATMYAFLDEHIKERG